MAEDVAVDKNVREGGDEDDDADVDEDVNINVHVHVEIGSNEIMKILTVQTLVIYLLKIRTFD